MKKYQYLASWDDQTLTRVGEPVVVLGDSNVSQVEVTLPSNFLLDPTKAECRMYFLLPGEKESGFETLETAMKDDNGDSHVTWTIKHVHSQKGGRLAFSLTLIGDDAQWDSRTAIIPVYESRYQPESEEAEEPYTGRLDALEGSMASIRGEFAEVQEDFEDLKETATLGTPIPESLVANMTEGHIYVYTGTETGYTAGHLYYYVNGTLTDGGQYGGTTVDATLTQSGAAADAKVTGDKIAEIKEDLSQGVALERYNELSPSWTLGFIKSDGAFGNSTNSVLSGSNAYSGFIIAESDIMSVEVKSGYKALVAEYVIPARDAVNFISKTEYATGTVDFNVHVGSYCLFVLMLESEQRFAPSDVPDDAVVVTGWRKAINQYNFIKPLKIGDGYFLPDMYINSKNAWQETNTKKAALLFKVGKGYYTIIANMMYDTIWALLTKDFSLDSVPEMPPFVQYGGRNTIAKGAALTIYVAQDSVLYVYYSTQGGDIYYPTSITCRVDTDSSLNVNGASADAKTTGNKFDYALAPLERIYNLYNSDDTYNGVGLNQGVITTDTTAKTTDFIAIPKKYGKNLLYTHLLINGEYGGSISFYDASKNYISTAQVTSYVQNVTDSEYIRCTIPIDARVTIVVSNETAIPQVREQLTFNNGRRNWFSQRMVSDGCMTSMIKTALAYTDSDEYGYGTEHTAFGEECIKTTKDVHTGSSLYEGERYQIDCSTYAMLIIMGIKPQCSRYHYSKNIPAPYGYAFNALANYEGWVYGVPQTMNTKRLYANSIADYANRNGYLYSVNDDFSNVQPGDIVFLSNQSASYNFFANIGHCAFVYNVIDMENGTKAIETLEANGGAGNPCHRRLYLEKPDKMLHGAKLPYSYVSGNAKNIANFSSDVSIAGDGTADIILNKPIRKGNVYTVIIHASDIMSGYITLSVDGLAYTGYTADDVVHRPDGIAVVRFTVPMSYDADATKIVLTYVGNDSITLNNVSVYDGYVTESII